jgi:hypothetical protein
MQYASSCCTTDRTLRSGGRGMWNRPTRGTRARQHAPTMPQGGGENTEGQVTWASIPGLSSEDAWWARQGLNL